MFEDKSVQRLAIDRLGSSSKSVVPVVNYAFCEQGERGAMDQDFLDLPEDDNLAFMTLESEFRIEFRTATEDQNSNWEFEAADYMNKTLAAAKALNIEALDYYTAVSHNSQKFGESFWTFVRDVDNVLIQMRVHGSRRSKQNSVAFTEVQKNKIHALIEKIRSAVEESSANVSKKEKVFNILATLAKEVSKPRTALARFGDLARSLAGVSKDVAEEGAEPWWKWAKLIFGEVDEAKDAEPKLPAPEEIKKIEPPRKELPEPKARDLDDEIPF
ncbi:hypothetical protein ACOTTU_24410 [Roseobacter sp. EG26]|uniref:hypothetical protein n=1 Tax=Roseobacter sp. EG26 TaxID=3412477 RepID=UPI003CE594A5